MAEPLDGESYAYDDAVDSALDAIGADYDPTKEGLKQQRWEEGCVRKIMTLGGREAEWRQLAQERAKVLNVAPGVGFSEFIRSAGNSFPVYLHFKKIAWLHKITVEQLLKGPKKVSQALFDMEQETPGWWGDKPIGLVFEWLHGGGQWKVIHTYEGATDVFGVQLVWQAAPHGKPKKRKLFRMENLQDFLMSFGWIKPS